MDKEPARGMQANSTIACRTSENTLCFAMHDYSEETACKVPRIVRTGEFETLRLPGVLP